jgi:hypothetical protein
MPKEKKKKSPKKIKRPTPWPPKPPTPPPTSTIFGYPVIETDDLPEIYSSDIVLGPPIVSRTPAEWDK